MLCLISRLNVHRTQEVTQRIKKSGIFAGWLDVPLNATSRVHVFGSGPVDVALQMVRVYLVAAMHPVAAHKTEASRLVFRHVHDPQGKILGELQAMSHESSESMLPIQ